MLNSTTLGSTRISFTSWGCARNKTLINSELIQTDLPEPVAPAMSRCGMRVKSQKIGCPAISRPSTAARRGANCSKSTDSIKPRKETVAVSLLGISTPIADLPGMGASIRTPTAARLSAMSSLKLTIRLTLIPGPGISSNRVIEGPLVMLLTLAAMPKLANVSSSLRPKRLTVVVLALALRRRAGRNNEDGGNLYGRVGTFFAAGAVAAAASPTPAAGVAVAGSGAVGKPTRTMPAGNSTGVSSAVGATSVLVAGAKAAASPRAAWTIDGPAATISGSAVASCGASQPP